MAFKKYLKKHGIVRNAIKEDMIVFAIPAIIVSFIGLLFCAGSAARNGLSNFWGTVWGILRTGDMSTLPTHSIIGLASILTGLSIMIVSQATLWKNYSSTVVIRENHQLITHGIYRFTRNPIYFGLIMVVIGLPVYTASLPGFVTMLFLIPIILNRIKLEERLLTEEFQEAYQKYKETTQKLIPFIY